MPTKSPSSTTTERRHAPRRAPLARIAEPINPFHPGEILLEEFLLPAGESQAAFASRIGWTKARLNELVKGKRGITAEAALDLAEVLGTSPRVWMNLQVTWDLAAAERRRRA
jgi:antitoxin HigA-1